MSDPVAVLESWSIYIKYFFYLKIKKKTKQGKCQAIL